MCKKEIITLYESGLSIYRIAKKTGANRERIRRLLHAENVEVRKHSFGARMKKRKTLRCQRCTSIIKSGELCTWCAVDINHEEKMLQLSQRVYS